MSTVKLETASGIQYKDIDSKLRTSAMPYLFDIAEGNVANHTVWTKNGYNGAAYAAVALRGWLE